MSANLDNLARRLAEAICAEISMPEYAEGALTHWGKMCESPIEALFLSTFTCASKLVEWTGGKLTLDVREQSTLSERPPKVLTVVPQYYWEEYRIDFAFFFKEITPIVFVECDGHNFHERTAEQAERDRRKDRAIQKANIPILRFTGRELYRDPFRCVIEVFDFIPDRSVDG